MFEVMKIFDNSLSDFKLELVQKGEEIAHLKVKLQKAEVRLKDVKCSDDKAEERNTSRKNQLDKDPDKVPHLSEQPSVVPEFDFEVPDDWCAPLGSEVVSKKDSNECPSVRLRKLYIPLWHVPVVKQEVDRHPIETHQHLRRGRSKSDKTLKAELRHTLDRGPFTSKQRRKVRERLVQDNSGDCIVPIRSATKEQKHTVNRKKKTEKVYSCRICHKDFNSTSGLKVHVRAHKCCKGCNKVFPSKVVFNSHKSTCQKYKKLMRKRGRPLKQKETISSSCMPSVSHKKHYMQCHVNEKTIKCSLCPRTFLLNKALKLHMTRIHMKKQNLSNTNEDSSWTMPLELTDTLSL